MPQNTILTQELSLATMYDKVGGIPSSLPFVPFFPLPSQLPHHSPLSQRLKPGWNPGGEGGWGATSL